jgi:acetolactate synthase-1/2/3 large subunit
MLFALHYLTAQGPDAFTIHLGLGSMASGIASAIGQALADRDRPVCCICGDGGMQMAGMELLVAVRERLPVYAVFNDARYNMVYHGYRQTFGRESPWSTPTVDFVSWARSLGANGERIDHPDDIGPEHFAALKHGPMVLDIRQDASVRIQGEGRIEAIRQMSMLHTQKEG